MPSTTTTFYGSCDTCGEGYWVDASPGPGGQMLGPEIVVVCQRHHPVGEAHCRTEHMMITDDRKKWARWRKDVENLVTAG
jgi:hypothetical protein